MLTSIVLYFLVRLHKEEDDGSKRNLSALAVLVGILVAVGYVVRPTFAVTVIAIGVYFLMARRELLLWYILGGLTVGALFVLSNYAQYENLLPPYYRGSRLAFHSEYFEALLGQLFSPSRGLFIYSPFLILGIAGLYRNWGEGEYLRFLCVGLIVIQLILLAAFPNWTGAYTFGPRYMSDLIPYFAVLLFWTLSQGTGRKSFLVLIPLGVLSCWIHARGVYCPVTFRWNSQPISVTHERSRVWELKDAQPIRGLNLDHGILGCRSSE